MALSILTERANLHRAIQFLGRYTLEIYVVHVIGSAGTRIVLLKVVHIYSPTLHIVMGALAGIFVPILAAFFLIELRLAIRLHSSEHQS